MNFDEKRKRYGNEEVLVIDKNVIPQIINLKEGYNIIENDSILEDLQTESYFLPRYYVEENPKINVAQIIPYITASMMGTFFTYKRILNGDYRGNGKVSIGIGGHINLCDAKNSDNIILAGALRELREEVDITLFVDEYIKPHGIIKCSTSSFDEDHLGIHLNFNAVILDIDEIGEDRKLVPIGMVNKNAIKALFYNELENWSKIIIDEGVLRHE